MKKLFLIGMMFALAGCGANLKELGSVNDTVQGRMQSCLMSEAQSRLQAGTLFVSSVTTTARELVGTCMQKLALQSAGISASSQSTAENIVSALRSMQGAN